jgi:uncharacterized protein (DUF1684 family)
MRSTIHLGLKINDALFFCLILVISIRCNNAPEEKRIDEYLAYDSSIQSWQENRIISLKKNWLSLAGLYKLEEGENSFGAHDSNDIVFPKRNIPDHLGSFLLNDGEVTIKVNADQEVLYEGQKVQEMVLLNDRRGSPTILRYGTFSWYIIKRVENIYVRLRDDENPDIKLFVGIENYPLDTNWRLKAQFEPHMTIKIIETSTTAGDPSRISSPGAIGFKINGQYYRLDVWSIGDSGRFQTIFADETSGIDTYGAGRFIVIEKSPESGRYLIDFNMAYNPPCAFTEFATCPLPPPQNRLPIKVTAGEKKYQDGSH